MAPHEPILKPVPIESLHPTQITVGFREVKDKQRRLREQPQKKIGKFLGGHMIPVVVGPKDRNYIIDHHHLALCLHREGVEAALVTVVADLSMLKGNAFWTFLDHHGWVYPYDAEGRRQKFDAIPKTVDGLEDDPYRSLAGELRRAGGFAKQSTPFVEFLWADFLRRRIKRRLVEGDFPAALRQAMKWAKSGDAAYLPGWCGPSDP